MIVNVNPFDTGFDENSHVMRFSAAAKEVQTIRSQNTTSSLSRFVHPSLRDLFNPSASPAPSPAAKSSVMLVQSTVAKTNFPPKKDMGQVIIPPRLDSKKKVVPEVKPPPAQIESPTQEVTIIEEGDDDHEEEQSDSFVDHLMAKYEEVRHRLYQSERQCEQIEAQVREEMAEEMSRRLQEMEYIFNTRIVQDSTVHDDFINRKLDLFGTSSSTSRSDELEEEDDDDDDDDDQEVEQSLRGHVGSSEAVMVEDQTMTTQEEEDGEVGEEENNDEQEEEDADDSILASLPKRKTASRRLVSMSESEEEEEEEGEEDEDEHEDEEGNGQR